MYKKGKSIETESRFIVARSWGGKGWIWRKMGSYWWWGSLLGPWKCSKINWWLHNSVNTLKTIELYHLSRWIVWCCELYLNKAGIKKEIDTIRLLKHRKTTLVKIWHVTAGNKYRKDLYCKRQTKLRNQKGLGRWSHLPLVQHDPLFATVIARRTKCFNLPQKRFQHCKNIWFQQIK